MNEKDFDILRFLEEGEEIRPLKAYGVGVDTHRDFIQVCVLVKQDDKVKQYEREFDTAWESLVMAGKWAEAVVEAKSSPPLKINSLTYTIESTSTYHLPVLRAFGGKPCVVNPVLAGHTRRKTDKLDARLLAYQNMTGLWPQSFVVPSEVQEYRLLMKRMDYYQQQATRTSNQINNYILRFGHTLGSFGSVASPKVRGLIEDMCGKDFDYTAVAELECGKYICPGGLPEAAGKLILDMYKQYDIFRDKQAEYQEKAFKRACDIEWETGSGMMKGTGLIKRLMTVPYAGEKAVLVWLAQVVTPLRFEKAKHLTAYAGCDPSLKISAGKVTSQTRRSGNKALHDVLVLAAGMCINHHREPFGQWGYSIYKSHRKGGYKKACGAVARRMAISLYYLHKNGEEFSYESYRAFGLEPAQMSILEMNLSKRVTDLLLKNGITDSQTAVTKLTTGEISKLGGFGPKARGEINAWYVKNKIEKEKKQ